MYLGSRPRRPHEDLQRVGAVFALATMGHVPVISLSGRLQEGKDVFAKEGPIISQPGQEGSCSPQGCLRWQRSERPQFAYPCSG